MERRRATTLVVIVVVAAAVVGAAVLWWVATAPRPVTIQGAEAELSIYAPPGWSAKVNNLTVYPHTPYDGIVSYPETVGPGSNLSVYWTLTLGGPPTGNLTVVSVAVAPPFEILSTYQAHLNATLVAGGAGGGLPEVLNVEAPSAPGSYTFAVTIHLVAAPG